MKPLDKLPLIIPILLLALSLRIPLLNGSFWLDEAAQVLESARPLAQQFEIIPDFQPPLIHLLLHFAIYFSQSEWWLRTVGALVPGLVSIYLTYQLAKTWKQTQAGLIAALLLSTSSFFVFYSQELRPYALPTLWAVLSWWAVSRAVQSPKGNHRQWLLYGLWSTLGLYSSFLYGFLILSQAVWLVTTHHQSLKFYLLAIGGAVAAFVPWLPTFRLQLVAGGLVRQDLPGWSEVVSLTQLKSLPLVFGKFIFGIMNLELNFFFVITCLALTLTGGLCLWQWCRLQPRSWKLKDYQTEIMLLCWLIIPLIAAWVVSFWIPVIQPKRVLYLLPALYLLIGVLVSRLTTPWLRYALVGTFLIINLISTGSYYLQPQLQRENWRSLHQEITQKYAPQSTILVFAFPEPFAPWRWYDQATFPTLSLGYLVTTPEAQVRQQLKPATEKQFVILFDYLTDLSDPQHKMISAIESFGFQPIEVIDYPQIGFVRVYSRPGMTVSLQ